MVFKKNRQTNTGMKDMLRVVVSDKGMVKGRLNELNMYEFKYSITVKETAT